MWIVLQREMTLCVDNIAFHSGRNGANGIPPLVYHLVLVPRQSSEASAESDD